MAAEMAYRGGDGRKVVAAPLLRRLPRRGGGVGEKKIKLRTKKREKSLRKRTK
jgi:hypothetical protein